MGSSAGGPGLVIECDAGIMDSTPSLPADAEKVRVPRARSLPILLMVLLGGTAALSWAIVWQIEASLSLGVSALGTALTLAATMGGVAIGSLIAGSWLTRRGGAERPLRIYGVLEALIGMSGLLMPAGFALLEMLDARAFSIHPRLAPIVHAAGVAMVLAPPTLAMGATVPVLQFVSRSYDRSISALYGLNSFGAGIGVLLLTFVLLPTLGVMGSCIVAATINAAVCGLAFALSPGRPIAEAEYRAEAQLAGGSLALPLVVVFVTGFATFGLEVAWFRAMRAAFWSTSATFAIILAAVLVPLAIGARLVPLMRRFGISPGSTLAFGGAAILLATPLVERLDLFVRDVDSYPVALLHWFAMSMAVVGPAVLLLATALPWLLEEYRDPGRSGRLYGVNALGSVLGSLTVAWLLLPRLGFARSAWAIGALVVATSLLLCPPRRRLVAAAGGFVALAVAMSFASSPGRDRMYGARDFAGSRILAFDEGPDFTASVVSNAAGARRLLIDGFTATAEDGASTHYMQWMGTLPTILHDDPKRGLVICFGTGQTANALRRSRLRKVDVVEISLAVLRMSGFFRSNQNVLNDPRVRPIHMDGRAWLRRTAGSYDVITLEPMPPNFSGVNALYSREFYEIAASRLDPGGIVVQWLPIHLLSVEHARSVAATFQAVFPDAILWIDPVGGTGILAGRLEEVEGPLGTRWPGLQERVFGSQLTPEQIRRGVHLDPVALARYVEGARIIDDDNRLLEYGEARPGTKGRVAFELSHANWDVLTDVAGREPYMLAFEGHEADRARLREIRREAEDSGR